MPEPAPQKPHEETIEKFISRLRRVELPDGVFNIYSENHPQHDVRAGAAKRRENLRRYIKALPDPKFALIGLCPGYRGARFTGIPFTDEAHLCWPGTLFDRTGTREQPWRERSATCVMDLIGGRHDVICWNVVPWHCHEIGNPLSNAEPNAKTLELGAAELEFFLSRIANRAQVVAVGNVAREVLATLDAKLAAARKSVGATHVSPLHVRHPAHGGEAEFREGLTRLLGITYGEALNDQ